MFENYRNKKVFITGITGFKGAWLYLILKRFGADVYGLGLEPTTSDSLYFSLKMCEENNIKILDIRNYSLLNEYISSVNPEILFHLAAQPLVLESYRSPVETYETNINGLINLFEVIRNNDSIKSLVVVTSDKCYRNDESKKAFAENDAMGGLDPYSASKSCAELISASYAHSFFREKDIRISTVRAGNIIGGGDWSDNRLIPDIIKSIISKNKLTLRYPNSTRPWQYVLDALTGYLIAGEMQFTGELSSNFDCFNFGPDYNEEYEVITVVKKIFDIFKIDLNQNVIYETPVNHEAGYLRLNNDKAKRILKWLPKYGFAENIERTARWYYNFINARNSEQLCSEEIKNYYNL